uniref:Related to CBF1-centromere binding factor 1 n=1 Tax=Ramularia collo-cygni TaxID=112498 RepID=A0A2D3VHH5_9PEZI
MASHATKRKRETSDMPMTRAHPAMAMNEFDQHYLPSHDNPMDHHDADMGFALSQHNAGLDDDHDSQQHSHSHGTGQDEVNGAGGGNASDTAAAAMAQFHNMRVPQSTEEAFMSQVVDSAQSDRPNSASIDQGSLGAQRTGSFDFDVSGLKDATGASNEEGSPTAPSQTPGGSSKPAVGTEEWHKVRRDNHKEVERRRRETINEGINELSKIVPGCEKNKGSLLARAVQFITQLKENETQNIEKWTLEKMLTEEAIKELSSSCDKLKNECQRAWNECEQWKKAAQSAGVSIDVGKLDDDDD